MLKTAAFGLGFQHLPRDLANVNAWKTMFGPASIYFKGTKLTWLIFAICFHPHYTPIPYEKGHTLKQINSLQRGAHLFLLELLLFLEGRQNITETYLYNFDPLKPHFYIVKLGFTGVYIIFLISAQNIDCGYSLEPPRRGGSNEYPQSMFWAEMGKKSDFFLWKPTVFLW